MAEEFPTTERHHPYKNRTLYGAAKAFDEGCSAATTSMYGLDYVALRYFNVYGPRMDVHGAVHRGARALDGTHRGRPAAADLRRRLRRPWTSSTSTTSPGPTCSRPRATSRDDVFNVASGDGDEPARARRAPSAASWTRDLEPEFGPERGVNPRPAARSPISPRPRARPRLRAPRSSSKTGLRRLVDWWRPKSERRSPPARRE